MSRTTRRRSGPSCSKGGACALKICASSGGRPSWAAKELLGRLQGVQRAARLTQVVARDVGVALRRAQAAVAQQGLDRPHVDSRLQEMRRKGVAQGVKSDRLRD